MLGISVRRPVARLVARLVAGGAAAAMLLAACSSGSSGSASGPSSFTAKEGAARVRDLGAVDLEGRAGPAKQSQPVQGTVDYRAETARLQLVVTMSGEVARLEYRQTGGKGWIRRAPINKAVAFGLPLVVFYLQGAKQPWVESGIEGTPRYYLTGPYDPAVLLDALAARKVTFRRAPSAKVDGASRRGFRATTAVKDIPFTGVREVTAWVDGKGTPLRMQIRAAIGAVITYDITRHDGRLKVSAPPKAQVQVANQPLPHAVGPYVQVKSGTAGGVAYTVSRAPSSDGGTCWKVQSTPPYDPLPTERDDGGVCIWPIETSGDPNDQIGFPIDASGATPYEMFAVLVPKGSTATVTLLDHTSHPVPIGDDGLALYAGPLDPAAALMVVTLPDGTKMDCAPGQVQTPADVAALGPGDGAELRQQAWNCLPAADIEG